MGLFTRSEMQLFTGEGIKRLYQFFLLKFSIILFQILIVITLILGLSSESISSVLYLIITFEILIIIWLFLAFIDMVIGRKEFDKQHEISVIIASAFLIPSIFLYLIQLVASKGLAISASTFYFNPSGTLETILVQSPLLLVISIILPILTGLALFLFIHKLSVTTEKVPLLFACGLLVTSPFTIYTTGLVAYVLFFFIYRSVYIKLQHVEIKPSDTAPCPFCDKDIPMESRVCPYCGTKFKENPEIKIDPILKIDAPKPQFNLTKGYTPVKGPTEEQKKRLILMIVAIIVIIVFIATLCVLLR